jgi:hypothetical protein
MRDACGYQIKLVAAIYNAGRRIREKLLLL